MSWLTQRGTSSSGEVLPDMTCRKHLEQQCLSWRRRDNTGIDYHGKGGPGSSRAIFSGGIEMIARRHRCICTRHSRRWGRTPKTYPGNGGLGWGADKGDKRRRGRNTSASSLALSNKFNLLPHLRHWPGRIAHSPIPGAPTEFVLPTLGRLTQLPNMEELDVQVASTADAIHVAAGPASGAAGGSGIAAKKQSPKRFECTHPGCNKRFTRLEHMQRHALNHSGAGDFTCSRCSAHFKRPDLLGEPL